MQELSNISGILEGSKRFAYILGSKARRDKKTSVEIKQYFEQLGYEIPQEKEEFQEFKQAIIQTDEKGAELSALLTMYKSLSFGYSVGALFVHPETKGLTTQTLFHLYNKHRLSHVWNWRKQQILRKYYKGYISSHIDELKNYIPAHLVLTLKRDKETGLYKGKKFYGDELIKQFNAMRKTALWKVAVYAGEYGLETKKGKYTPGYHIHIHSLCMINRVWNFEALENCTNRQIIESIKLIEPTTKTKTKHTSKTPKQDNIRILKNLLKEKTCNLFTLKQLFRKYWQHFTDSTQIHLERLYTWETENGKIKTTTKTINGQSFKMPVKKYLTFNSEPKDFLNGILECIKYHFKGDTFTDANGNTDIESMGEVLAATKGKRLYSRFGAWYADPYKQTDETDKIEEENAVKPIKEMFNTLIHPYTQKLVKDFCIVSFQPHERNFYPKDSAMYPTQSHETELSKFIFINDELPLGELIKNLITGKRYKVRKPPIFENEPFQKTAQRAYKSIKESSQTDFYKHNNPLFNAISVNEINVYI